jgi:hypothetical protein
LSFILIMLLALYQQIINVFPGTHYQEVREVLSKVSRLFGAHPIQRSASALFDAALQSRPALALQEKSPSLAVISPYGAPMPHTENFFIFSIPPLTYHPMSGSI